MMRRRRCPEVIQTSAMDCGPASLTALLGGIGVRVSYGRLREACQTDVDGTSIDTLEEVAVALGIEAEQVMVPVDHVLEHSAACLPAIVVTELPNGLTHFVVVWSVERDRVQVMDPAAGRRFMAKSDFLASLYRHAVRVPAAAWEEWARSDEFVDVLRARTRAVGGSRRSLDDALAAPGHLMLAALDGAVRLVASLVDAGAIRRGRQAKRLLAALVADGDVPADYRSVVDEGDGEHLRMRGAVLIRVRGIGNIAPDRDDRPADLNAALAEPPRRPLLEILAFVREGGWLAPLSLLVTTAVVACGVIVEAVLFRSLLEVAGELSLATQRVVALAAITVFALVMLCLDLPRELGVRRLARALETRMRLAFLTVVPRLGDRYFRSRPVSDMASRIHHAHRARALPELGGQLVQAVIEIVLIVGALFVVSPATGCVALAMTPVALAVPVLTRRLLAERDLRLETHSGGLSRFYLDALLGTVAIRTHSAERAVRREHEHLLTEWCRAGFSFHRLGAGVQAATSALGFASAIVIVFFHAATQGAESMLLVAYWALAMPMIADRVAQLARAIPVARTLTLRLLEPLGAELEKTGDESAPAPEGPVAIEFRDAAVVSAGHTILEALSTRIAAGEHVAIVGPSGAGKSTLVGLLLGFAEAQPGAVLVDGEPLSRAAVTALRTKTVWVDPEVQLWQRGLLDNLLYGNSAGAGKAPDAIRDAELTELLARLDDGMQANLGEGGRLLSGGEGQRVRLARGMLREQPSLVVLDEAFRGLDRDQRKRLLHRVRTRFASATILCVTHDIEHALDFPRALVVADGRLCEDGTPAQLAAGSGVFASLLQSDRRIRTEIWGASDWRRIRVADGTLEEATA